MEDNRGILAMPSPLPSAQPQGQDGGMTASDRGSRSRALAGRRLLVAVLGLLGAASMAYVVSAGIRHANALGMHAGTLVWALFGALPLFVFGTWLLFVSRSRAALFFALSTTATAISSASETAIVTQPGLAASAWFLPVAVTGVVADAVAGAGMMSMFAAYPTGDVERRWQRVALGLLWIPAAASVLRVLTSTTVPVSGYVDATAPNPLAVPALAGGEQVLQVLQQPTLTIALGLMVLVSRLIGGGVALRRQLRPMAIAFGIALVGYVPFLLGTTADPIFSTITFVGYAAVPIVAVHGILRFGAFDIDLPSQGRTVAWSSNLMISLEYAIACALPGMLLVLFALDVSVPWLATVVLLTALAALVLLPLRGWAQRRIHRTIFGDRDRQLADARLANADLTERLAAQLKELTASRARLVAAQDDERRRLERDLHDGIQQDLVALIAEIRLARNRLQRREPVDSALAALQDHARDTLTELRELAHGIHPAVLSDNGLVAAVESGVARYPLPLEVDANLAVRTRRYPEEIETAAYYVIREALTNVAKHAQAATAKVTLAGSPGILQIGVSDDGCGIAPSRADPAVGGLANIRDRVATLRGSLHVSTAAGGGTVVLVELPTEDPRER